MTTTAAPTLATPTIELRPFATLGAANHGWLDAHHHFSFADYHDPDRVQWGALRVWNDDAIAPRSGFPPHPHRDMEIVTYVRQGAISHRDSLGNEGRTVAGDVQVMSAGTGITHAEYNLEDEETRLFQIWILPDARGHTPSWGTRPFPRDDRAGGFVILASGMPGDADALRINARARVAGALVKAGDTVRYSLAPERHAYLVPASGRVRIGTVEAAARDGVAITGVETIEVTALEDAELVLVDAL
ncbi:pirin family protein [Novosphingobium piscinae]|uniref:Pirin family protein n=1 Tax=Novosphingobium piscinae TaxID=1507448 RepID=A0A7X1KQ24_9SPHN|nr:pirin family protein [Novosphingobium piscinae]MBC2669329.1 pirin family protein [Novosphingobium piscinae]